MNLLARLSYGFPAGLRKTLGRQVKALNAERRLAREIDEFALAGEAKGALPDFLIIGAPKCGTSWLSHALRRQPGIFVVPDEIEYFSSRVDRPLDWYLAQFRNAPRTTQFWYPALRRCSARRAPAIAACRQGASSWSTGCSPMRASFL